MKVSKNILKIFAKNLIKIHQDLEKSNVLLSENLLDKVIVAFLTELNNSTINRSIFKFSTWKSEESMEDDPIVWFFTEEMIQQEAEMEINRRLTDVELHRVFYCFFEDDETLWNRMVLIREAIINALEEPEQWSELDKDFLKTKVEEKDVSTNNKSKRICN